MFRIATAIAFACVIVLASDPSDARARIRMSAPSKPVNADAVKPAKPAKTVDRPRSGSSGLVVVPVVRPFAAARRTSDDGSAHAGMAQAGPVSFAPLVNSEMVKAAATADTETATAHEPAAQAAPERQAGLVALSMNHPIKPEPVAEPATSQRFAASQRPVVCYVQLSGACVPH